MTVNSIKNAIVTVTLLAVGYGSYIVLSEPGSNAQYLSQSSNDQAAVSPASSFSLPEVSTAPDRVSIQNQQPVAINPPVSIQTPNLRAPESPNIDSIPKVPAAAPKSLPEFTSLQPTKLGTAKSEIPVVKIDVPTKREFPANNG